MYIFTKHTTNYKTIYPDAEKLYGPYQRKDGRWIVVILQGKKKRTLLAARLILEITVGRQLVGDETVDHIDGNNQNDSPENLQVLSIRDNAAKSADVTGLREWQADPNFAEKRSEMVNGHRNARAAFTAEEVEYIRSQPNYYGLVRDLMAEFGVCRKTIQKVRTGVSYFR